MLKVLRNIKMSHRNNGKPQKCSVYLFVFCVTLKKCPAEIAEIAEISVYIRAFCVTRKPMLGK